MNYWFLLVLMSLTAYRGTRLVIKDTFPPVLWLRDRLAGGWRPMIQEELDSEDYAIKYGPFEEIGGEIYRYVVRVHWSPQWFADLLSCAWCASGWISLGVVMSTSAWTSVPLPALTWCAVWALGGLLASQERL